MHIFCIHKPNLPISNIFIRWHGRAPYAYTYTHNMYEYRKLWCAAVELWSLKMIAHACGPMMRGECHYRPLLCFCCLHIPYRRKDHIRMHTFSLPPKLKLTQISSQPDTFQPHKSYLHKHTSAHTHSHTYTHSHHT